MLSESISNSGVNTNVSSAHQINLMQNECFLLHRLKQKLCSLDLRTPGSRMQQPVFSLLNCGNHLYLVKSGGPIIYRLCGLFLIQAELGADSYRHIKPTTTI